MSIEELEIEVMQLPSDQRAKLAELLIASLDEDEEIEAAWMQEAERRLAEIDSGKAATRPAADVFADARARFA
jgi:putative addiction module component (TIGR02574 family)